jgi:hypothetical protein
MTEAITPPPTPEPPPAHPVLVCAGRVVAAVREARDHDPMFMSTEAKAEAMLALLQARDQVDALLLSVLGTAGEVAEKTGARDVASWLAPEAKVDRPRARALQWMAGELGSWQRVRSGVETGGVNLDQARVIVKCLSTLRDHADDPIAPDVLDLAEAKLVELAAEHSPRDLETLGERIVSLVAPEIGEERDRKALEAAERRAAAATKLHTRRRGDGSTDLHVRLPDEQAARLKTFLDAFTSPRTSEGPTPYVDPATGARIPRERLLGEAFCSLLEAIPSDAMPLHGGSSTTLVVTIDLEGLKSGLGMANTGDGTTISAAEARRLACTANLVPMVLGGASQPLDVGRARRFATKAQRLALAHQHPTCRAQGCDVPATWCEAHHWRLPWAQGGKTDLADLGLLCSWHHHRAHDPTYATSRGPDGAFTFHRRT